MRSPSRWAALRPLSSKAGRGAQRRGGAGCRALWWGATSWRSTSEPHTHPADRGRAAGRPCGGRGSFPFPIRRSHVPQPLTRAGTTSTVKEPEKKRSTCRFCVLRAGSWRAAGSPSSWPDPDVDVSGPPGASRSRGVNAVVRVQPCLVQNLGCGRWGSLSVKKRGSDLLLDVKRASCASGRVGVRQD